MSKIKNRLLKLIHGKISIHQLFAYFNCKLRQKLGLSTATAWVFERIYMQYPDPWKYETSAYELQKYEQTLALLPQAHFERILEVACSIGVFTQKIAPRAHFLEAIDISKVAVERAKYRCRDLSHVHFQACGLLKFKSKDPFDLICCAEVLDYFLPRYEKAVGRKLHSLLSKTGFLVTVMEAGKGERWRRSFTRNQMFEEILCNQYPDPGRSYEIHIFIKPTV